MFLNKWFQSFSYSKHPLVINFQLQIRIHPLLCAANQTSIITHGIETLLTHLYRSITFIFFAMAFCLRICYVCAITRTDENCMIWGYRAPNDGNKALKLGFLRFWSNVSHCEILSVFICLCREKKVIFLNLSKVGTLKYMKQFEHSY